jgi:nicotinate phosphoribosyltransferase
MNDGLILAELESPGLHTDFYEITMSAGYFSSGRADEIAHFELFIRGFGNNRKFYLFCGLQAVLEFLERWRFSERDIDYLSSIPALSHLPHEFFNYLANISFTGDFFSVPEGEIVFPNEPIIRVRAPLIQAQLLETALLAIVNHQTSVATKAARVVHAASGRQVVEFGSRRAHGLGAAAWGGRAAFIGGCTGTSNCYTGCRFGIPVVGTVAHSWIMSFDSEEESFDEYARTFPDNLLLLIDTYDTLEGARKALKYGTKLRGVRIDSGDLLELSKSVRRILDDAGLNNTIIFASGDLNESKIQALIAGGAPINAFGVGSELITSRDAPALGGVYKLVALEDRYGKLTLKRKLSALKATIPGPKQILRRRNANGKYICDTIEIYDGNHSTDETELVRQYIADGNRIRESLPVQAIAAYAASSLSRFDDRLQSFESDFEYQVKLSDKLEELMLNGDTSIPLDET